MFAGMSTQAARMIDPEYTVLPVCNWYFMVASTVLITVIGTLVTDRLVEPRLGPWGPVETGTIGDIGENERRGMGWAGITVLVYVAFFQKYDKDAGIGSVISTMLPYSGAFLLGWIVLFTVWYLMGLPLGPGSGGGAHSHVRHYPDSC